MSQSLVPVSPVAPLPTTAVPAAIAAAGPAAAYAWDEFFAGMIANPNTRAAYLRAVRRFLAWCDGQGVDLTRVTPGHVGRYLAAHPGSPPTKKQHLAAIRRLLDQLVLRHVLVLNPAASVRGERYSYAEGKTPLIPVAQCRALLDGIDTSTRVGLRDRAILGVLAFTAARSGAVAKLRVEDFKYDHADGQWLLRFREKGGKQRAIPVRHDLQGWIRAYLAAAEITPEQKGLPLFRAAIGRTGRLSRKPLDHVYIWRLVRRRLRRAGIAGPFSPHSFRVKTVTDLLHQGVPLEDVQHLCGHSDPRTTKIYDRRQRQVGRNLVERITT